MSAILTSLAFFLAVSPMQRAVSALTDDTFSYSLDVNFKGGK